ncbi:hypothetical protein FKP32DRAFT_1610294 [Trametes sanguinea]|nr:hypothetical protein FKP32DRAFT_1610294 [Trametes sanguinea]
MCIRSCLAYMGPFAHLDACPRHANQDTACRASTEHCIGPSLRSTGLAYDSLIKPEDMLLMFSIDGTQFYESKMSNCWVYIWAIHELRPEKHFKKCYVLPGAGIPGPKKSKNIESFIFPGLYHIVALQRDGLWVWDSSKQSLFKTHLIIIFTNC